MSEKNYVCAESPALLPTTAERRVLILRIRQGLLGVLKRKNQLTAEEYEGCLRALEKITPKYDKR